MLDSKKDRKMKTYTTIKSWHGTGPCKTVELSVPFKGYTVVSQVEWYGCGFYNTALYPGDREAIKNTNISSLFSGSLEDAGYTAG